MANGTVGCGSFGFLLGHGCRCSRYQWADAGGEHGWLPIMNRGLVVLRTGTVPAIYPPHAAAPCPVVSPGCESCAGPTSRRGRTTGLTPSAGLTNRERAITDGAPGDRQAPLCRGNRIPPPPERTGRLRRLPRRGVADRRPRWLPATHTHTPCLALGHTSGRCSPHGMVQPRGTTDQPTEPTDPAKPTIDGWAGASGADPMPHAGLLPCRSVGEHTRVFAGRWRPGARA